MMLRIGFVLLLLIVQVAVAKEYKSPQKPITLKPGENEFTLVLNSNPSTGYAWYLTPYHDNFLKLKHHSYRRKNTKPGSPGEETWTFEVTEKAQQVAMVLSLNLMYLRSWESEKPELAEVIIFTAPSNSL